ncbi:MAG: RNA polymerase sigma factor [Myxococcota bacterium]
MLRLVGGIEQRVSECVPWLHQLALRLTRSPSDAQDLVQDTVERALRNQAAFDPKTSLQAWLTVILNNLFLDRCRRRHLQPQSLEGVDVPSPSRDEPEPLWATLSEADVVAAAAALPDEFRAVFTLHREGLGYQAIAERLGIPRATVGTRLLRARRLLREHLTSTAGRSSLG